MSANKSYQPPNSRYLSWLRWVLALTGGGLMVAMLAVLLPVPWIAATHRWLGLGEFPDGPIVVYLARSTSLLYAVHGFLIFWVSFDLRRYWALVRVLGWLHIVIGVVVSLTDITTPMPTYWLLGDTISIFAGALTLWLWHRANEPLSLQ